MHENKVRAFQTSKETDERLTEKNTEQFTQEPQTSKTIISIDPDKKFQQVIGFGGAFTEAAAYTLQKLSPENRQKALNAYFHPEKGIHYTFCRTHINSCDFSLGNYSYCDIKDDIELKNFSIERDKKLLIPLIKDALKISGKPFKLFASPWSPPAWMKTNNQMNHGGALKKEYYDVWALYFVKYIKAYAQEGINIWGITVQNEPEVTQPWDSCRYTSKQEAEFVKNYLAPALKSHHLDHIRIMVWDHNKDRIYERSKEIFSIPDVSDMVWGIAFHWYDGNHYEELTKTHNDFPDKHLVFTEGCIEGSPQIDDWKIGERYGHDIISDLNNWTVAWTDWNMVLDEQGGPNHVDNFCNAPIIAHTKEDKLYFENSYYYIAHFSKFIMPGAVVIGCNSNNSNLEAVACQNPDTSIILVVLNQKNNDIDFQIKFQNKYLYTRILKHSIITFII